MSALSLVLLLTTAAATVVGAAALHGARGLREELAALRRELGRATGSGTLPLVPAARQTPVEEIRAAVAEALAEERERELAEARAFWAAQESRDAAESSARFGGEPSAAPLVGVTDDLSGEELPFYVPRQSDFVGLESLDPEPVQALEEQAELEIQLREERAELAADLAADLAAVTESAEDSPELAAARRRHPSHPDFVPDRSPVVSDHEQTVARLEELASARTALADVRPGPLGTLDVYVFADGTTLCVTPGHRETAEQLADALRLGRTPALLGGSTISGAYALTDRKSVV